MDSQVAKPAEGPRITESQQIQEEAAHRPIEPVAFDPTSLPFLVLMCPLSLALLLTALNSTIVSTIIPVIATEFDRVDDVGWYASSFLITTCAVTPLTGQCYHLFSLRWNLVVFLAFFVAGSLLGGLASTSAMVVGARAISGIGSAGILTGCISTVAAVVPLDQRSGIFGVYLSIYALGQAAGPVVGGTLASYSTWRWCFFINVPIGSVAIVLIAFVVTMPKIPAPPRQMTISQKFLRLDMIGCFIFAVAIILMLVGVQWGGTAHAWNSAMVAGLLSGGFASFGLVAVWFYYKGDGALIPVRFFQGWNRNAIGLTSFAQGGGLFLALNWLPFWFQAVKETRALKSGLYLLPLILSQLVFSAIGGQVTKRTGYYLPAIMAGNSLIAIGSGLLSLLSPSTGTGEWIGFQIVCGAGRGLVMQVLVTAMQAHQPQADAAMASAYVLFYQFFGGAIFSAVAKTILTSTLGPALLEYAPGVDVSTLTNTGVSQIRQVVPLDQLAGVQLAYNKAIVNIFYLQLGTSCCALLTGLGTGWKSLKRPKAFELEA